MAFLFKSKKPSDVAKSFDVSLQKISKQDPKSTEKYIPQVTKDVASLKVFLYGDTDTEPLPDALQQIASEFISNNTISIMITAMEYLEFEVLILFL